MLRRRWPNVGSKYQGYFTGHFVPYANCVGENFIFMYDNGWSHVAALVQEYLNQVGVSSTN